jgi:hypothetical protein
VPARKSSSKRRKKAPTPPIGPRLYESPTPLGPRIVDIIAYQPTDADDGRCYSLQVMTTAGNAVDVFVPSSSVLLSPGRMVHLVLDKTGEVLQMPSKPKWLEQVASLLQREAA